MNRSLPIIAGLALMLVLAGCSTRGTVATETLEEGGAGRGAEETTTTPGAETRGLGQRGGFQAGDLEDPDSLLSQRVVYFEFDSSEINERDMNVLRAHAEYLAAHPEQRLIVEGHTDERGSREYNLALGERRAHAVRRILTLNGVAQDQVEGTSFGEEKPVVYGQNEAAWSQNRRAELVYTR
jgi:peptidoglycan-associated lipoprotein